MNTRWQPRSGVAGASRYPSAHRHTAPWPTRFAFLVSEPRFFERIAIFLLGAVVFTIPWEDALVIPGVGTVSKLVGVVAIAAAVLAIVEKGSVSLPHPSSAAMVLFVLWTAASLLWTSLPNVTGVTATSNAELVIMSWLIWELCDHERKILFFLQAFVLGCYVSSIDTIFEYLHGQQAAYERYAGSGFNPNDLALVMVLSIPMAYYLSLKVRGVRAWINRLAIILALTTIFLSGSRGALVTLIVALAIIPLTYSFLTTREKLGNGTVAALALCIALIFVPAASWQRLATAPTELEHGTLNERTVIWTAGLSLFSDHPVQGVGAGTFPYSVAKLLGQPLSAHNTFLSVLVEDGLVGFCLFLSILVTLLGSSLRLPPLERYLWIVLLSAWTVGMTTAAWEARKPTWFLFGLCVAQVALHWSSRRRPHVVRHASMQARTAANYGLNEPALHHFPNR
jgi:O-antigen ligase